MSYVFAYKWKHPKKEGWQPRRVVAMNELDFYRLLDRWNWQTDSSGFVYISDPSVPSRWAMHDEGPLHHGFEPKEG